MARRVQRDQIYADAFTFARNTSSFEYGWRKLRQAYSSYDRDSLKDIYDKVWDRAQRVRYMEDSNQGWFLSRSKVDCPESGNRLFYTFQVTFRDEDGNQHEQYKHVNIPIEQRIGQSNQAAVTEMIEQLASSTYFRGWEFNAIKANITNISMVQVKCLTGGD